MEEKEFTHEINGCRITVTKVFNTSKKRDCDGFYKTFFDSLSIMNELSNRAKSILQWLCTNSDYNTGIVRLTSGDRKEICESYKLSNNGISNLLKELKDKNIIAGNHGFFYINPKYFWKGDDESRERILKDKEFIKYFNLSENE